MKNIVLFLILFYISNLYEEQSYVILGIVVYSGILNTVKVTLATIYTVKFNLKEIYAWISCKDEKRKKQLRIM